MARFAQGGLGPSAGPQPSASPAAAAAASMLQRRASVGGVPGGGGGYGGGPVSGNFSPSIEPGGFMGAMSRQSSSKALQQSQQPAFGARRASAAWASPGQGY